MTCSGCGEPAELIAPHYTANDMLREFDEGRRAERKTIAAYLTKHAEAFVEADLPIHADVLRQASAFVAAGLAKGDGDADDHG